MRHAMISEYRFFRAANSSSYETAASVIKIGWPSSS